MRVFQPRLTFLTLIFGYTLLLRLLPYGLMRLGVQIDPSLASYPWNFSPALAVCLFGGACFSSRGAALLLPLATFLVSDLGIWAITGRSEWAFYPAQVAVYVSLAACTACGFLLRQDHSRWKALGMGFVGCTLFFLITNFAWWGLSTSFPHTWEGLARCYYEAIPHYRNLLIATTLFGSLLFSPLGVRAAPPNAAEARTPLATA